MSHPEPAHGLYVVRKALTVYRPWAYAIVHRRKIENRTWAPTFRGWLAIHAGLREASEAFVEFPELNWLQAEALAHAGHVIGVARLVDVAPSTSRWAEPGYQHWHFADQRGLSEPIRVRGAQGLWTLPSDVTVAISAQLRKDQVQNPPDTHCDALDT